MKKIAWIIGAALLVLLSSCSDDDYLNAIPRNSKALISIDVNEMEAQPTLLTDFADCGVDLGSKVYLFETVDGDFGLCAHLDDEAKFSEWIQTKVSSGECESVTERRGIHFAFYHKAWLMGYLDNTLMILGPVVAAQQANVQMQMATYLKQDAKRGIRESRIYERLDSIEAPVRMVAQTAALPEKMVAPFTLGSPADVDASQVWVAARVNAADGILHIVGETFSFNKRIDAALKASANTFRPLEGRFSQSVSNGSLLTILMNADGEQLLPMIQQNKGLKVLMAGVNTAIDMDNILRSVDGDLCFSISALSESSMRMSMGAQVGSTDFWKDSVEWRKSAPSDFKFHMRKGSGGKHSEFFCGNDPKTDLSATSTASNALSSSLKDQCLCMVLQLNAIDDDLADTASSFLKPLFGDVSVVLYTMQSAQAIQDK
ncbi:MAG: DUF4836 family protein [Prevotella sp.]|nr:DUF4836 family protein [Prevotella sp.]